MKTGKRIALLAFIIVIGAMSLYGQSSRFGSGGTATFTLHIVSNAPNSRVFINAVAQSGVAPLDLNLAAGEYEIVVRASGYRDYSTKINLTREMTVSARLVALNYQFVINSNVRGADVYIDGKREGVTPLTLSLQAGRYDVAVKREGYENYEANINLNRDLTLNATLRAVNYNVTIGSNVKGAIVFVNDVNRGEAPVRISLQSGTYTIRVAADGYQDETQSLQVNRDTNVNVTLQPALSQVLIIIPEGILNTTVKDPLSLIKLYVDREPVSDQELRERKLVIRPGRHTIWVASGGFLFETTAVFQPSRSYSLRLGTELSVVETESRR